MVKATLVEKYVNMVLNDKSEIIQTGTDGDL